MSDPRHCQGMTIDRLDDVERYLRVHLITRVGEIDETNLRKCLEVIERSKKALDAIECAVHEMNER